MNKILILKNKILNYAWGSKTDLSQWLGEKRKSSVPQAELWMGAHPNASSEVQVGTQKKSLADLIRKNPGSILGQASCRTYGKELPFLLKILAVDQPLSLQAHPNAKQAREGFLAEQSYRGRPSAEERNFKDPHEKPEIICALSPFLALCGFRPFVEIAKALSLVLPLPNFAFQKFKENPTAKNFRQFFLSLLSLSDEEKNKIIKSAVAWAKKNHKKSQLAFWVLKLYRLYPSDIGILAPLMLHLIHLKAGEALFLEPGVLHAYLKGMGVELMGNSDNVLRGGLTQKRVDVKELIKILKFQERKIKILRPEPQSLTESYYQTATRVFRLSQVKVSSGKSHRQKVSHQAEIWVCSRGRGVVRAFEEKQTVRFKQGISFLIPAAVKNYRIEGVADLFKATCP